MIGRAAPKETGAKRIPAQSVRGLAGQLLMQIVERRQPMDGVLAAAFAGEDKPAVAAERDRALVKLLLATTLRRLGEIDWLLAGLMQKPLPQAASFEKAVLRLGAAQLIFLSMPAHAVVDQAVSSLRDRSPYRGLVNAILRKISTGSYTGFVDDERTALDPLVNLPAWLSERWVAAYGSDTAAAIARQHLEEPPLDLSIKGDCAAFAEKVSGLLLPQGSVRLHRAGVIEALEGFGQGDWWVQDAAATLPVRLLNPRPGEVIFDLCAAPGGKSAQLAVAGAAVVAVDRAAARVARLRANMARLGLKAETIVADILTWMPPAPADAVLLDAPCSATGTIRRHPDVAWTKRPEDLVKLNDMQDRMLQAAASMVKPGGRLVYCVCSLETCEGPARIEKFLATTAGQMFRRAPIHTDRLPGLEAARTEVGDLRTLPHFWADKGGMDGFYACCLVRS